MKLNYQLTKKIKQLRNKGLTIREIAKVLKMGSTTVFYHLNKENQTPEEEFSWEETHGYQNNEGEWEV